MKSYLTASSGYFRYRFTARAPDAHALVYFPFWRFKGMMFSCLETGIQHRFIDISQQAVPARHFPLSVGVRSQALKLKFISPEDAGHFIKPVHPINKILELVALQYSKDLPQPILHQDFIGEATSIIYSPYYVSSRLYDAILDRPVTLTDGEFSISDYPGGPPDCGIGFLPTLCPDCGWDMEGAADSLVMLCKNCETAWKPHKNKLKKISVAHMPESGDDIVYLPFWQITADVSEIQLKTYADFVRCANLPKMILPEMEEKSFSFWGAAFKVRPNTLLNLSIGVTLHQLQDHLQASIPQGRVASVNLPASEAVEGLKFILAKILIPRERMIEMLPKIDIHPKKARLVYLPFREKTHELVQESINLAVNKNQLRLASNL